MCNPPQAEKSTNNNESSYTASPAQKQYFLPSLFPRKKHAMKLRILFFFGEPRIAAVSTKDFVVVFVGESLPKMAAARG